MNDNTANSIAWICSSIIIMSIVFGIIYYNIKVTEIDSKTMLSLVEKYDINPMILNCMDQNWSMVSYYQICKIVSENPKITKGEVDRFLKK